MKYIFVMLICGFLAACSTDNSFNTNPALVYTHSNTVPNLPPIEPVNEPELEAWEHDLPRDLSKPMVVKNITVCKNTPVSEQTVEWWSRCGEYPIVNNTNIFIGFDQENWYKIVKNFEKLKEVIQQYKQRIKEVDNQREVWRNTNEQNAKRSME